MERVWSCRSGNPDSDFRKYSSRNKVELTNKTFIIPGPTYYSFNAYYRSLELLLLNNNEVNAASERRLRKYADCSHHAVVLLEVRTIAAEHMRQGALPYCCISYTHTHRAHIRFDIFLYDPLNPQNFPGLLTDMQK